MRDKFRGIVVVVLVGLLATFSFIYCAATAGLFAVSKPKSKIERVSFVEIGDVCIDRIFLVKRQWVGTMEFYLLLDNKTGAEFLVTSKGGVVQIERSGGK